MINSVTFTITRGNAPNSFSLVEHLPSGESRVIMKDTLYAAVANTLQAIIGRRFFSHTYDLTDEV